ncbi:hypothetical protein CRV02_07650 [Arcobacter sp. CECT 8989]|uniref:hypothetical protein n=1 Tax=Arcobacter sp. CECT 8989 TaxID=2044509 RepID=UPI00100B583B|nr:hypothetical protein [Arcobacter sp. CECT 8989]RXK01747.1 hypothetical protein CRV02_07650 [Arcobacter sp. CECT 8989]
MNLLQYRSDEMVSSTELIRKSKNIFNKLQKKEIEKAVILRDGKPQFMLLDFDTYEELMSEYLSLKQLLENGETKVKKKKAKKVEVEEEFIEITETYKDEEIKKDELEEALAQIEKLGLEEKSSEAEEKKDDLDIEIDIKEINKEKQPLKDFWE